MLYGEVDTNGRLRNIRVTRGLGLGLEEKAIEAVKQWRFRPGTRDGKPVVAPASIEVNFHLL
jgi:TonB family protein